MFTSVRNKHHKYRYFIVTLSPDQTIEVDETRLLNHEIIEGTLYLSFEDNEYLVHKGWFAIDYAYNRPQ